MMPATRGTTPAQAGAYASTEKASTRWQKRWSAFMRALCLADTWVPAFAGME